MRGTMASSSVFLRLMLLQRCGSVFSAQRWADLPSDGTADHWSPWPAATGNHCADPDATPIILDWDANIDDVVALAFLAKQPKFVLKAVIVTATGFSNRAPATANTFRLLELLGLGHVDVGVGPMHDAYDAALVASHTAPSAAYARLIPPDCKVTIDAWYGVSHNYLPYSPRHAHTISEHEQVPSASDVYKKHADAGVMTVLTLGTMTSLHRFMLDFPQSYSKLTHLYAMIGAVDVPGNIFTWPASHAEFNAMGDPHAARAVLASTEIENVLLIPLDATNDVPMTESYLKRLATLHTPEGRLVSELTHRVRNTWHSGEQAFFGQDDSGTVTEQALRQAYFFWDSLAVSIMCDETIGKRESAVLEIVASDPPDLDLDGWLRRNATAGRLVNYVSNVPAEQAALVESRVADAIDRDCIVDQPIPLGRLIELLHEEGGVPAKPTASTSEQAQTEMCSS